MQYCYWSVGALLKGVFSNQVIEGKKVVNTSIAHTSGQQKSILAPTTVVFAF